MTMLEWYAGQIASAILAGRKGAVPDYPAHVIAKDAFDIAEALLHEAAKRKAQS